MNKILLTGFLTKDPELYYVAPAPDNRKFYSLLIRIPRDQNQRTLKRTDDFFDIKISEVLLNDLNLHQIGDKISIEGSMVSTPSSKEFGKWEMQIIATKFKNLDREFLQLKTASNEFVR